MPRLGAAGTSGLQAGEDVNYRYQVKSHSDFRWLSGTSRAR